MQVLVLASGSQYRAQLLERLHLPFRIVSPDIDESVQLGEPQDVLAQRLAKQKAQCVATMLTNRQLLDKQMPEQNGDPHGGATSGELVIGSDQVACVGDRILGKPGSVDAACAQLAAMSGNAVSFYTSLHIIQTHTGKHFSALDITVATTRILNRQSIERYVDSDKPLGCAGSFKAEALGISLFSSISSEDPTALVGLPLISVCEGLRQFGVELP